jgi:SAM-dependent methyltransferase
MDLNTAAAIVARYKQGELNRTVAPDDGMYVADYADQYWTVGESGLICILNALVGSWCGDPKRILDLPCGHGRVGRHLKAAFPDAEVFGCDLDRSGVDFCDKSLNMAPIYSEPELTNVNLPSDLDVIWVGSLFTHVDEERTKRWLSYLVGHLAPNGVLVATFHGLYARELNKIHPYINANSWARVEKGFSETGFGYAPYTEFDLGDYGVSLCRPSKILDIATEIPKTRVVGYVERGWAYNHDVLALTKSDRLAT